MKNLVFIKEEVTNIVARILENDDSHFLIDVLVSDKGAIAKVTVYLDGDKGVSIDKCAEISRKLGNEIEELSIIDQRYNLEVSSPGIDYPLKLLRQYHKNIGRELKVSTTKGEKFKGKLSFVSDDHIELEIPANKKKKIKAYKQEIKLEEIEESKVEVSFK